MNEWIQRFRACWLYSPRRPRLVPVHHIEISYYNSTYGLRPSRYTPLRMETGLTATWPLSMSRGFSASAELLVNRCLQCFDTLKWVTEGASNFWNNCVLMCCWRQSLHVLSFSCLHALPHPSPLAAAKSRMVWHSGTGLPMILVTGR